MSIKTRTSGIMVDINVEPATAPASATTWDPTQKSTHIALSGGDLVALCDADSDFFGVRSVASISGSAKIYYEVVYDAVTGSTWVGLCTSAWDFIGTPADTPNEVLGFRLVNADYQNPSSPSTGSQWCPAALVAGDRIGVAYDAANARIWARKNGGDWNNNGANDPATNTGGFTVSLGAGSVYVAILTLGINEQTTARFSSASWQDAAPAGFTQLT